MPSPSEMPEALAARQREHRLKERVRPKMPVDAHADPWLIAVEGLDALDRVRPNVRHGGQAWEDLEVAAERLRRLAWGPAELPAPVFDVTTHSGRMRKNMHERWHVRGGRPCTCRSPGP
jgi:hypothetical protein